VVKLGVFGGSFDPPHIAHVLAVRSVLVSRAVDRVVVMPVYGHAFGKRMASFEDRMAMCELAFSDLLAELPGAVEVSRLEAELPPPSYTLHTLQELGRRYPEAELRLVVGGDVLRDHGKWYRWDAVVALAPLVALGRVGVSAEGAPQAVLPDVSSTDVRAWLAERSAETRRRLAEVVPQNVLAYVDQHGLYR
jgi:nicotinate-nucleotide adenylyltransferase